MHPPIKRRGSHRGQHTAGAVGEFYQDGNRIERIRRRAARNELGIYLSYRPKQIYESVEDMQRRSCHRTARRFVGRIAPSGEEFARVLVAIVSFDVEDFAQLA